MWEIQQPLSYDRAPEDPKGVSATATRDRLAESVLRLVDRVLTGAPRYGRPYGRRRRRRRAPTS